MSAPYFTWAKIKIREDNGWAIINWLKENFEHGSFVVKMDTVYFKNTNDKTNFIDRCPGWVKG